MKAHLLLQKFKMLSKDLNLLARRLSATSQPLYSAGIVIDVNKLEPILKELDITNKLNESEQKEALPYLLTAYKALDFINKSKILKGEVSDSATRIQSDLNEKCMGIAKELSTVYSFSSLTDALMQKEDRGNYILQLNSGQNLEWVSCATHDKTKCIVTKNYIDNILSYLKNEKITYHLSLRRF